MVICYETVYIKGASGEKELLAKGFEQEVRLSYVDEMGKDKEWIERRFDNLLRFVHFVFLLNREILFV